jgi:signal peptide peptidase sppA, 36K type
MSEKLTPFPKDTAKRKKKLAVRILIKSLVYAFAIFGILFILLLLVILGLLRQEPGRATTIPRQTVLKINFDEAYREVRSDNLLTEISEVSPLSFYDLVKAINLAAIDDRVKVLVGRVGNSPLGLAQIQELRQAVATFRSKGKKAYIFSAGFGSFGGGTSEYYLASAFDEIWMQPNTDLGLTGIAMEVPFFRKLLDKVGIKPEFYARHEYKNAMASVLDERMSEPFRQEMLRLGGTILAQTVSDISVARGLSEKDVNRLINRAPLFAAEALEAKLIDRIGYEPELFDEIQKTVSGEVVEISDYASVICDGRKGLPKVAVLVADGVINEGKSIDNPLQGEATVGAATVTEQLNEIARDKNVKALLLRVNSPGGSYAASNEIWYALNKLKKERQMPVVVSMGNYAASGGYFIALPGDKIIAEPSTITGSIGVLGGKMVLNGLWQKLDINWEALRFGSNAGILSMNTGFSESEKDIFNKSLDNVYEDFTLKVSQARKIDAAKMDELARGRIWTGSGALKNGLIDDIGGFNKALGIAKELAGIKPEDKFTIAYYPKQKTLQEKISEVLGTAPMAAAKKVKADLGLDIESLTVLKRMQYDAVLLPFVMKY